VATDRVLQLSGGLLAATLVRGSAAFAVATLAKKLSRETRHLIRFAAIAPSC
jgi:hypothetical protein